MPGKLSFQDFVDAHRAFFSSNWVVAYKFGDRIANYSPTAKTKMPQELCLALTGKVKNIRVP